jgi:hypothetical protein
MSSSASWIRQISSSKNGWTPSGTSASVCHGVAAPVSSSRERIAFRNASANVRPMPIVSPTDFICVPSVRSAPGNFSNAKRGNLTTT